MGVLKNTLQGLKVSVYVLVDTLFFLNKFERNGGIKISLLVAEHLSCTLSLNKASTSIQRHWASQYVCGLYFSRNLIYCPSGTWGEKRMEEISNFSISIGSLIRNSFSPIVYQGGGFGLSHRNK